MYVEGNIRNNTDPILKIIKHWEATLSLTDILFCSKIATGEAGYKESSIVI